MGSKITQAEIQAARSLLDELESDGVDWMHDGPEFTLWNQRVENLINRVFTGDEASTRIYSIYRAGHPNSVSPSMDLQGWHVEHIPTLSANVQALVEDLEARGEPATTRSDVNPITGRKLRIFIAHDGQTAARARLEDFVRSLDAEPVIAEREPSMGKSLDEKIAAVMKNCDFAIALATRVRANPQDDQMIPRANVLDEIPRIRSQFGDRWMFLFESGVNPPSNEAQFVREQFNHVTIEQAYMGLVRELRGHGMLIVTVPSK